MAPTHVVRRGECLATIARRYGVSDWRTIYDHAENADYRERRPDPNVIYPGDRLFVPEPERRTETGSTGREHRFRLKGDAVYLRLQLRDRWGGPLAGRTYELDVGSHRSRGETDADGRLEERIAVEAAEGHLTVWVGGDRLPPHHFRVRLGDLDPETEVSGVQGRLQNLGFATGPIDGRPGPKTADALRAFQAHRALPVTGEIDDATRAALKQQHLDT